jgi:hypothetical protein
MFLLYLCMGLSVHDQKTNSKNINGKKEKLFPMQTKSLVMRLREDTLISLHSVKFLITTSLFPSSASNGSFRRSLDPTCHSPVLLIP